MGSAVDKSTGLPVFCDPIHGHPMVVRCSFRRGGGVAPPVSIEVAEGVGTRDGRGASVFVECRTGSDVRYYIHYVTTNSSTSLNGTHYSERWVGRFLKPRSVRIVS